MMVDRKRVVLLLDFSPHLPVLAPKKQQWVPLLYDDILNFGDEDRMIPCEFGGLETAFEISERSMQDRSPVPGSLKPGASLGLRTRLASFRPGIVLRNCPLVLA